MEYVLTGNAKEFIGFFEECRDVWAASAAGDGPKELFCILEDFKDALCVTVASTGMYHANPEDLAYFGSLFVHKRGWGKREAAAKTFSCLDIWQISRYLAECGSRLEIRANAPAVP